MLGTVRAALQQSAQRHTSAKRLIFLIPLLLVFIMPLQERSASAHRIPAGIPPIPTFGYYVGTLNPNTYESKGCQKGYDYQQRGLTNSVEILDFGGQIYHADGTWGTQLVNGGAFISNAQIEAGVDRFATGFYQCTTGNTTHIRIVVGTNNSLGFVNDVAGAQWAGLVNRIADYVRVNYGSQIDVSGGNDLEVDFSTWYPVYLWIQGWNANAQHVFHDFGDAAGCYPYNPPGYIDQCRGSINTWTRENIWYKSTGSGSRAIPEIFYDGNQGQWQKVSLYSYVNHGGQLINFWGALTQENACSTNGPCPGTLTPSQGWTNLIYKLNNNDPAYHGDANPPSSCIAPPACHRTNRPELRWSADMSYIFR